MISAHSALDLSQDPDDFISRADGEKEFENGQKELDGEAKRVGRRRRNVKVGVGGIPLWNRLTQEELPSSSRTANSSKRTYFTKGTCAVNEPPLKVHPEGTAAYGVPTLEQWKTARGKERQRETTV